MKCLVHYVTETLKVRFWLLYSVMEMLNVCKNILGHVGLNYKL